MPYLTHTQRVQTNLEAKVTKAERTTAGPDKWLGDLTKFAPEEDTLLLEPRKKPKRPSFYKVVLLNDDYTPMDFVVEILMQIFRKTHEEAVEIMYQVHNKGIAIVGRYTRDVAETKIDQVMHQARQNDYPLQCTMEKE